MSKQEKALVRGHFLLAGFSGALRYQALVLEQQLLLGLFMIRVQRNAVYRTNINALGGLIMAYTFGTQVRIDLIDLLALGNGPIGAFRLTYIAIDAFVSDYQGHGINSLNI